MTSSPLNLRCGRRQYLITYSQADEQRSSTRGSFANVVVEESNRGNSAVKVSHWACCRELHQEGGFHYHCAVKLTGNKKWISVKAQLTENHNIVVNFSDKHNFYTVHIDISGNKIITLPIFNSTLTFLKLDLHVPKNLLKAIGQLVKKDTLCLHVL